MVVKRMDNEQWLTDGNCSICRKKSYCKKDCKKASMRMKARIQHVIQKKFVDAMTSVISDETK